MLRWHYRKMYSHKNTCSGSQQSSSSPECHQLPQKVEELGPDGTTELQPPRPAGSHLCVSRPAAPSSLTQGV